MTPPPVRIVLISGLSGAGRSSVLRALEDLDYEAVDNPPLSLLDKLVAERGAAGRSLAVGIDARNSGFEAGQVLAMLQRLRQAPGLRAELVFATAETATLLRRFTETRRRHPLAAQGGVAGGVAAGITAEIALTGALRDAADLVLDTSDLPLAGLRQVIAARFGGGTGERMTVSLLSFAFPAGLPREADMVFDARFLRNPHYDNALKLLTGLDPQVGTYVAADPDYTRFFDYMMGLLDMLLPRFVAEGKKYLTIAVGCTGGRHRSVHLVERLADRLGRNPPSLAEDRASVSADVIEWNVSVTHRELARHGAGTRRIGDHAAPTRARES